MQPSEGTAPTRRRPRSKAASIALAISAALLFAAFVALGTWQVQRRAWKLNLIERVTQRVDAPAQAAPGPGEWPRINAAEHEYRHVRLTGTFLHQDETLVQASTVRGGGFWVLTPLRLADGGAVLVNRGFVPPELKDPASRATCRPGPVTVTGLLRLSEPGGGFLRHNDPVAGRWYSRDVQAIARAHGLRPVAPYFVDADAASSPGGPGGPDGGLARAPEGGLTVLAFPNNHLVYAITWYTLALMVVGAAWMVVRLGRREARMRDNAGHAHPDARHAGHADRPGQQPPR